MYNFAPNSVRFYKNLNLIAIKFTKDLAENARFFYMYKYEQIAKTTTSKGRYQVLQVTAPLGNQYYQIQKNRIVIKNYSASIYQNKIRAISSMLQIAYKDINQLDIFQNNQSAVAESIQAPNYVKKIHEI